MEPDLLRDKVVVITGASAGVGRATVRAFAKEGARIGMIARNTSALEHARREAELLGGEALVCRADVAEPDQVEAAAAAIEETLGPIDIWVNNAMVSVFAPVREMTPQEYRRVTDVTYLGYVHGTLAALKRMLPRDRGVIVQVGSALAYRGIPLQSAYCAAKHAIQGFTDSLRSELIHDESHVRVTMVQLPALNTPQFSWVRSKMSRKAQPIPPIFQPEVAADAILYAATNDRREVYVGGSTARAIMADKIAPGLVDRFLGRTGYESQQTEEPADFGAADNLFTPVNGDRGAHGEFDDRSRKTSAQFWMSRNRSMLGAAGMGMAGALALTVWLMGRRTENGVVRRKA